MITPGEAVMLGIFPEKGGFEDIVSSSRYGTPTKIQGIKLSDALGLQHMLSPGNLGNQYFRGLDPRQQLVFDIIMAGRRGGETMKLDEFGRPVFPGAGGQRGSGNVRFGSGIPGYTGGPFNSVPGYPGQPPDYLR